MAPDPINISGRGLDLSPRVVVSATVAASPAAGTETTICTVTIPANLAIQTGVILNGWAAYTVGTSGTAATLKIRQTNTSGTTVASTGALSNHAAGVLAADDVNGLDTAPSGAQVYVLTLLIASGAATSTVSACYLSATVV